MRGNIFLLIVQTVFLSSLFAGEAGTIISAADKNTCALILKAPSGIRILRDAILPFLSSSRSIHENILQKQRLHSFFSFDAYNRLPQLKRLLASTNWEKTKLTQDELLLIFANNIPEFSYLIDHGVSYDEKRDIMTGLNGFLKKLKETSDGQSAIKLWNHLGPKIQAEETARAGSNSYHGLFDNYKELIYDVLFELDMQYGGRISPPIAKVFADNPSAWNHISRLDNFGTPVVQRLDDHYPSFSTTVRHQIGQGLQRIQNRANFATVLEDAFQSKDSKPIDGYLKSNGVFARTAQGSVDYFMESAVWHDFIHPENRALSELNPNGDKESFLTDVAGILLEHRYIVSVKQPYFPTGRDPREYPMEPMLAQSFDFLSAYISHVRKHAGELDKSRFSKQFFEMMLAKGVISRDPTTSIDKMKRLDPEKGHIHDLLGAFGVKTEDRSPFSLDPHLTNRPDVRALLEATSPAEVESALFERPQIISQTPQNVLGLPE